MNFSIIIYIIGRILQFEGAFLLLPAFTGLIYGEFKDALVYFLTAFLCFVVGFFMGRKKITHKELYAREGFACVALSWITMGAFGALPFVFTGDIPRYIDALFETISGFTTTGASILNNVEALSHANLFWRSFTHWIGGMGVFVFMMAILPMLGASSFNLMKAESPGPSVDKLVPKLKNSAKILYCIYIGMTILEIICLLICRLPLFETLCTTFGTVGTGGFGVLNSSMSAYSPAIQNVVTVFMILSGINYTAYFCLLMKEFKQAFAMEEVRWYLIIILVSVGIITWNITPMYDSVGTGLRHAFFQVGSIITTTGFMTTDFNLWPELSKNILVILMFIGACAGSTGGGMKISRLIILFKAVKKELSTMIHPRMVRKIRLDGHVIANETLRSVNVYVSVYFMILFISLLLISLDEFGFTTNFTAVIATLNNIGPGLDMVGPTQNFSIFSSFSKCVLIFDMLVGRLELFPVLILFMPSCWKKY